MSLSTMKKSYATWILISEADTKSTPDLRLLEILASGMLPNCFNKIFLIPEGFILIKFFGQVWKLFK